MTLKSVTVTPYDDVNGVLSILTIGLAEILGDQLVGLYLTGSLTYGDFDRSSSDIDFLAVLTQPLADNEFKRVKQLHHRIGDQFPEWAKRLEGSYVTLAMLASDQPPKEPRLYVNNGRLKPEVVDDSWTIDLYDLQESGIKLIGPDLKAVLPPISIDQVRAASRAELRHYWKPWLEKQPPFHEPGHDPEHLQAFAVLTMCRILHRAKNDGIASKRVAANWTKQTFGDPWKSLIKKAEHWHHGQAMNSEQETLDFIRFTLQQVV